MGQRPLVERPDTRDGQAVAADPSTPRTPIVANEEQYFSIAQSHTFEGTWVARARVPARTASMRIREPLSQSLLFHAID